MMLKLVVLAEDQRVVGVHVIGPGAAEMIQMSAIVLGMRATKTDFDRAVAVHPTAGEELVTFKAPSYRYRGGVNAAAYRPTKVLDVMQTDHFSIRVSATERRIEGRKLASS